MLDYPRRPALSVIGMWPSWPTVLVLIGQHSQRRRCCISAVQQLSTRYSIFPLFHVGRKCKDRSVLNMNIKQCLRFRPEWYFGRPFEYDMYKVQQRYYKYTRSCDSPRRGADSADQRKKRCRDNPIYVRRLSCS